MIVAAISVLLITLEIIFRAVKHSDSYPISTTIVNAATLAWFIVLTLLNKKTRIASWLVCPSLTAFSYYYFTFVDYDGSSATIFYKVIVGISMTFFFLVILNE